jgi:hypothetical protein
MFLSIISGGAALSGTAAFCVNPLHSARYDSVPHRGLLLAIAACRCFLDLFSSGFIGPAPLKREHRNRTTLSEYSIAQWQEKGKGYHR